MPTREFVMMRLAQQANLHVASIRLHAFGSHQALMVQRFDRGGDPFKHTRQLYASAHTALRLRLDAVRGDPERSDLALADRLRIWTNDAMPNRLTRLSGQLNALWRRMAFNALVSNTDDHALNTGLLPGSVSPDESRLAWSLSPVFDITPNARSLPQSIAEGPSLSLATGVDGASGTSAARLAEAAQRMGVRRHSALEWLQATVQQVAQQWERAMRDAAGPILEDSARMDTLFSDVRPAFAHAEWVASQSLRVARQSSCISPTSTVLLNPLPH